MTVAVFLPAGVESIVAEPFTAFVWVLFVVGANLITVPMLPRLEADVTMGAPIIVAAAVLFPPPFTFAVNLVGSFHAHEFKPGTSPWLIAFNRAQKALSAGAAGVVAHWTLSGSGPGALAVRTAVAVLVFNAANTGAISIMLWLRGRLGLVSAARGASAPFPRFAVGFGLVTLLALLLVIAYQAVGGWAMLLLALPLGLGYSALKAARESEDRAQELAARVLDLESLNLLGSALLSSRTPQQIQDSAAQALRTALARDDVVVQIAADEVTSWPGDVVVVPGEAAASIRLPDNLEDPDRARGFAEAVAGLVGLSIQRLRLESALAEVQQARTALSGRILEEATRERSRIALDIHDHVLPYLAAAEIQADNVRSALQVSVDRADSLAGATREAVSGGIARLRELLDALRDQVMVPGQLRAELASALHRFQVEHRIATRLRAPATLDLPLAVELLVFDTVRGCLANVARHAEATHVDVVLRLVAGDDAGAERLTVTVTDDGVGFDPQAVPEGHHGIDLMRQRVALARGRLEVTSRPGTGTAVRLDVPL